MTKAHGTDVADTGMLGLRLAADSALALAEMTAMLNTLCEKAEARHEPTVLVVELAGEPQQRSWPGAVTIAEVNRWERAVRRLERLEAVSITVARGTCGGPMLDLLLASSYRIGTGDLHLLLPVNDGQFWPGLVMYRLAQQVGAAKARQLVLWGDRLTSEHALELGVIDEVNDKTEEAVRAAAILLGRTAGPELAVRRLLLLEATTSSYEEALGAHLAACDRELRRLGHSGGR